MDTEVTPIRSAASPLATGPLAFWLLLQLAALAIAAGRVPLAARYPITGERLAMQVELVAQIGASSLLFPWILRNRAATILSIGLCWPMLALARALSGMPPSRLLFATGYVSLWLTALATWRVVLRSEKSRMLGTAVAAAWVIGGPLLWYLRAEFNTPGGNWPPFGSAYGPISGALAQVRAAGASDLPIMNGWLVPSGLLMAGIVVVYVDRLTFRRRRNPSGSSLALPAQTFEPRSAEKLGS